MTAKRKEGDLLGGLNQGYSNGGVKVAYFWTCFEGSSGGIYWQIVSYKKEKMKNGAAGIKILSVEMEKAPDSRTEWKISSGEDIIYTLHCSFK